MKIKKIYLLFLFAILFSMSGKGQNIGFSWDKLNENSSRLHGKLRGEEYLISLIGNSYFFLHKEWFDATITLVDNDVFENVKVRYLAYGDELISLNENLESFFYKVDKDIVKEFLLKEVLEGGKVVERKFIKLFFDGLVNEGDRYLEELYAGSKSLLAFNQIVKEGDRKHTNELGVMSDADYRLKITFYMYSEENGFTKLLTRKRSFIQALPAHKKEIRKIFRQNKIKLRNKEGMIKTFALIDETGLLNK